MCCTYLTRDYNGGFINDWGNVVQEICLKCLRVKTLHNILVMVILSKGVENLRHFLLTTVVSAVENLLVGIQNLVFQEGSWFEQIVKYWTFLNIYIDFPRILLTLLTLQQLICFLSSYFTANQSMDTIYGTPCIKHTAISSTE